MNRPRHESLDEESAKSKDMANRFPSPKVDSDQFLRIISWQEPVPPQQTPSPTPPSEIAETVRSWYRNLSRRTIFIALIILLTVLFIIAIIITVAVVFVHNGDHHAVTAVVFTMPSTTFPPPTAFPLPVGFVVATLFRYTPLGVVTSLVPDTRAFDFRQQLLSYGNGSLSLLRNDTVVRTTALLNTSNCAVCTVLSADDQCFSATNDGCAQSQILYCCTNCLYGFNFCRVKGVFYEFSDQLVETRVFSDGSGLQLTTASQISSPSCVVQTHRVAADGTIFSGSIQNCQTTMEKESLCANYSYLSSTTINPDLAITADILTLIDADGGVQLTNLSSHANLAYLPMKIKGNVLSVTSTVQNDHLLVAVLQSNRFYSLRYTISTTCVAVLNNYYETFLFSGELRNFDWAGDTLILWYVDRSGVNVVEFQFAWDDSC